MNVKSLTIFLLLSVLIVFSGCATPVGKKIDLQPAPTVSEQELKEILGKDSLFVTFSIKEGEVSLEKVGKDRPAEKLEKIYAFNRNTLDKASGKEIKTAHFRECVKISDGTTFKPCYNGDPPEGSLFRKTSIDGGDVIGTAIASPFLALALVLDTSNTIDDISKMPDRMTNKETDQSQVNRLGINVASRLATEIKSSATSSDAIFELAKKYPSSGLGTNAYLLDKMAMFAAEDYTALNKESTRDIENFIDKYSQFGTITCFSPTVSSLNVRIGPGEEYNAKFVLTPKAKICKVLKTSKDWIMFSGKEVSNRYNLNYWANKKYLKAGKERVDSAAGNELSALIAKANVDFKQQKLAEEKKRQRMLAAEAERKRIAEEKRQDKLRKQKLAKIQPQLNEAINEQSMVKLETFITQYKQDPDAQGLVAQASANYKKLLFE